MRSITAIAISVLQVCIGDISAADKTRGPSFEYIDSSKAHLFYTVDWGYEGTSITDIRTIELEPSGSVPQGVLPKTIVENTSWKVRAFDVSPNQSALAYCSQAVTFVASGINDPKAGISTQKIDAGGAPIGVAMVSSSRLYLLITSPSHERNPSYDVWRYDYDGTGWIQKKPAIYHSDPSSHLTVAIAAREEKTGVGNDTVFVVVNNDINRVTIPLNGGTANSTSIFAQLNSPDDYGRPTVVSVSGKELIVVSGKIEAKTLLQQKADELQDGIIAYDCNDVSGSAPPVMLMACTGGAAKAALSTQFVYFTSGDFVWRNSRAVSSQSTIPASPLHYIGAPSPGSGYPPLLTLRVGH